MAILLDLTVPLILILAMWIGYKRGFIRTVTGLTATLLALILAYVFSGPIAGAVFEHYLQEPVQTALAEKLDVTSADTVQKTLSNTIDALPDSVATLIKDHFGTPEEIAQKFSDTLGGKTQDAAANLTEKLIRPAAVLMLRCLCFALLFLVIRLLLSLALRLIDNVCKLPVLKQLNAALGLCLGLVQGAAFVLIAVAVMQWLAFSGRCGGIITREILDSTFLVHRILSVSPITGALAALLK